MLQRIKYLYRAWRYRYKVDPAEIRYIRANLSRGDTVIDIGAHKGAYSYWMQRAVGKEGKVIAFEPQGKLYDYLSHTFRMMGYDYVRLEHKGLSSQPGIADFYIPETASGSSPGARINSIKEPDRQVRTESIAITTLDEYAQQHHLQPAFIKMDVEGHEWDVIKGGKNILNTYHPTILMECENRHLSGRAVSDVIQLMEDLGYEGRFFLNGKLIPVAQFDASIHQKQVDGSFWEAPGYVNNFVFEAGDKH